MLRARVDAALEAFLGVGHPRTLHESMRYSLLAGGKRVRPILCLAACELVGGDIEVALPTACALEMVHTMSLIHDDLPAMDDDDYRRGRLANHKVHGEHIAILAGDALLAEAFGLVVAHRAGIPAEHILAVIFELARAAGSDGLAGGQVVDLESEGKAGVGVETLDDMHARKTAALLSAAVVSGAILGGASAEDQARLRAYARGVGLAFQIIDDILDVTSTREAMGKTAGKDARAGKATYASVLGPREAQRRADAFVAAAKAELLPFGERARPLLVMADSILTRDR
jgi:geranylgeranyl diphosphate synthase type II